MLTPRCGLWQIIKAKQSFQRAEVTREEALDMFEENKFKVEIISNLPTGSTITLYRSGEMVDLCRSVNGHGSER
jgi:threonyl-tRNA synthetase